MSTAAPSIWDAAVADAVGKPKAPPPAGAPPESSSVWTSAVNDALGVKTPTPPTPPITGTERAMQQTMGGPPMFVDVPKGTGAAFEQAGQRGYQICGAAGAGMVTGAALGGAALAAAPGAVSTIGELAAAHPVAAAVIKTLVRGGLLKAGWETAKLLGKVME